MKRILIPLFAGLMLLGCGQPKQSDPALIADFYAHILGDKPVEDGSSFTRTAKAIFGDRYPSLIALMADEEAKKAARIQSIRDYADSTGIKLSCYQDYGWPAVSIE